MELILSKNGCVSGQKNENLMDLKNIHYLKINITKALKITISITFVYFIIKCCN